MSRCVDQPYRRLEMPMAAMWRTLRVGAGWPAGRVEVPGLTFDEGSHPAQGI
jgi:hypothetical protein